MEDQDLKPPSESSNDEDNWVAYEESRLRNDKIYRPYLQEFSKRAYEYGVLAIKSLLLISGGALVAIPTVLGINPNLDIDSATYAGKYFGLSLLLSIVCIYIIHLNWMKLYKLVELQSKLDHNSMLREFLPSRKLDEPDSDIRRAIDRSKIFVGVTFYAPHFIGLAGIGSFGYGIWLLFESLNK